MEVNDIVIVKQLDYTKVVKPTDEVQKKKQKEIMKELTSLSGIPCKIVSKHTEGDSNINFVQIEGLVKKRIKVGETEHPITLREDEVTVVETDYLNNCCREQIYGNIQDNFICQTCGFNIKTLLNKHTS